VEDWWSSVLSAENRTGYKERQTPEEEGRVIVGSEAVVKSKPSLLLKSER
jgi:hypothetical protein